MPPAAAAKDQILDRSIFSLPILRRPWHPCHETTPPTLRPTISAVATVLLKFMPVGRFAARDNERACYPRPHGRAASYTPAPETSSIPGTCASPPSSPEVREWHGPGPMRRSAA